MKRNPSKTEWAYLAGIIDGEGCIALIQRGGRSSSAFQGSVAVGNTSKNLIDWLLQTFEGTEVLYRHRLSTKWMYRWYVKASNTVEILKGVLPYLIIKEKQAEILLQYRETVLVGGRFTDATTLKQRVSLAKQMHKLNSKGKLKPSRREGSK